MHIVNGITLIVLECIFQRRTQWIKEKRETKPIGRIKGCYWNNFKIHLVFSKLIFVVIKIISSQIKINHENQLGQARKKNSTKTRKKWRESLVWKATRTHQNQNYTFAVSLPFSLSSIHPSSNPRNFLSLSKQSHQY